MFPQKTGPCPKPSTWEYGHTVYRAVIRDPEGEVIHDLGWTSILQWVML